MEQKAAKTNHPYRSTGEYLLHLMACALNGHIPQAKPETVSWEKIWDLAAHSNVESIAWPAVKLMKDSMPEKDYKSWEHAGNAVFYRQLQFDVEREATLGRMSEEGLSYLPLKGILLKDYYPAPGMRYMCDNDILYGLTEKDPAGGYKIYGSSEEEKEESKGRAQQILCEIMKERDYCVEQLHSNHDVFQKEPIFNFEMHKDLMMKDNPLYAYYANPWKRAVPDEKDGTGYGYHFSDEDEYIYFLVHAYKHYSGGGCGIRTLADEYVFMKKKGERLDRTYLQKELETLKLTAFEKQLRNASMHAFAKEVSLTEEDRKVIGYMMGSGTYGNLGNSVNNKLTKLKEDAGDNKKAKRRYMFRRIWVSEETMKAYFPFFYKHRFFRIFLPFYRFGRGMIVHPKRLLNEYKSVKKYK